MHKKNKIAPVCFSLVCFSLAFFALAACSPQVNNAQDAQVQDTQVQDHHNSQNALDWAGSYRGTLPCADCGGIVTIVNLQQNGHYDLYTQYLKDGQKMMLESGAFTWDKDGRSIRLQEDMPYHFQVGENILFMLDQEGRRIDGALAENYRLTKVPDADVTEHYWKLVALHGQPVQETNRDVHFILKRDQERVSGSGGCNQLSGQYKLSGDRGLDFGAIAMTEMACPAGMDVEQDFITMLQQVRSFVIRGDVLVLYGASKQEALAHFQAVYLR